MDFGGRSFGKGQQVVFRLHTNNHLISELYRTEDVFRMKPSPDLYGSSILIFFARGRGLGSAGA